ncbi:hypothetical protein ASZ90_000425 [hydrocarbon metagenome]|uniref:Uncharacterized protein n=1 Tax=hydrocarbon metagenome TaxID=938273 RepID=A0A0W8GAT5_9ZZZZ
MRFQARHAPRPAPQAAEAAVCVHEKRIWRFVDKQTKIIDFS